MRSYVVFGISYYVFHDLRTTLYDIRILLFKFSAVTMTSKKIIHGIDREGKKVPLAIEQKSKESKGMFESMAASGIGYYLIIPLLAGLGLGLFLDEKLETKPLFTIIGIVIGVIGTFYNLFKVKKITE